MSNILRKKCSTCGLEYDRQFFTRIKRSRIMKLTKSCFLCRQKMNAKMSEPIVACKMLWETWKKENHCIDCGEDNAECIQADHIRGEKIVNCSEYIFWGRNGGTTMLSKELLKCDPRCRCCHILRTKKSWSQTVANLKGRDKKSLRSLKTKIEKQKFVVEEKLRRGQCAICKKQVTEDNAAAFIFDHSVNWSKKNFTISNYINKNRCTLQRAKPLLIKEMLLCRLLCANCDWVQTRKELFSKEINDPRKLMLNKFFLIK